MNVSTWSLVLKCNQAKKPAIAIANKRCCQEKAQRKLNILQIFFLKELGHVIPYQKIIVLFFLQVVHHIKINYILAKLQETNVDGICSMGKLVVFNEVLQLFFFHDFAASFARELSIITDNIWKQESN
jgi:hypothetical protein